VTQRLLLAWLSASLVLVAPHARQPASNLVIVVDGLRPDQVTPKAMPRLTKLAQSGIVFTKHHSVFPTVTRVNAASLLTGAYPETHGLLGNTVYIPSANPTGVLDTSMRRSFELIASSSKRILTAPTMREILSKAHLRMLALAAGSSGLSYLLNDTVGSAIIHSAGGESPSGEKPTDGAQALASSDGRNRRAIDAYLNVGLGEFHPDVTYLWLNNPDEVAHLFGFGSTWTVQALAHVDAGIGRILDALRVKGLADRTNILVVSDHGFSMQHGDLKLRALLERLRLVRVGSPDLVVADGAIYLRGGADRTRLSAIVAALQRQPEVGAIFSRPRPDGGSEGVLPGTLSYDVARWNHGRSGDLLVSANWSDTVAEGGLAGQTFQAGVAGHGTSSPFDVHATLIAAGPDFREHATSDVPTSNVDIAPTLLHLLGMPIPPTMSGRPMVEGLSGRATSAVKVERFTEVVRSPDGKYELTAHISVALNHRYLDYTDVKRH